MSEQQEDQQITCVECMGTFVWTIGQQDFYRDRGLAEPKRCPACREARKTRLAWRSAE